MEKQVIQAVKDADVTKAKGRAGWYTVDMTDTLNAIVNVEAKTADEAREKAKDEVLATPHMYGLAD